MKTTDDRSIIAITVTVAHLRQFVGALRARYDAVSRRQDAERRLDEAKADVQRALRDEAAAIQADITATKELHGSESIQELASSDWPTSWCTTREPEVLLTTKRFARPGIKQGTDGSDT